MIPRPARPNMAWTISGSPPPSAPRREAPETAAAPTGLDVRPGARDRGGCRHFVRHDALHAGRNARPSVVRQMVVVELPPGERPTRERPSRQLVPVRRAGI